MDPYYFEELFNDPNFIAVIGVLGIICAVILVISFVFWILRSAALSRLAKNRGMRGAGLAWIPFIGYYRAGSIADDISAKEGSKTPFRYLLLIGLLASWVLSGITGGSYAAAMSNATDYSSAVSGMALAATGISSLTSFLSLAIYIITIIVYNKIFKCYRPGSATAWTVLSAIPFTAFLAPIFLFMIRNDIPAVPYNPQQQGYYPPVPPNQAWQAPPQSMGYNPYNPQQPPQAGGFYPQQAQQQYQPPGQSYHQPPVQAPQPQDLPDSRNQDQ